MKIVAVSQRVDIYPERNERRDALDQRLIDFILAAGALPVPVPNSLASKEQLAGWLKVVNPSAIVLSGGNDIGQSPERDLTERSLLDFAQNAHLPVLGICRGMQMLGLWSGAELRPVLGHIRSQHTLTGRITGRVNSYHTYALTNCPASFEVLAWSEDGTIEAIRHESHQWEGWMWHPEREPVFSQRDLQRIQDLIS